MNNSEKQEYLNNLLKELSENTLFFEDEDLQREIIEKLKLIYTPDFRHSYSDLFFQLQDIFSNSEPEAKDTLTENLSCLRECFGAGLSQAPENEDLKEVFRMFTKYYDHINLEVGRYNFISEHFSFSGNNTENPIDIEEYIELSESIERLNEDFSKQIPVVANMAKAAEEMEKLDTKLAQNSVSSITTLTIFSAVILAFSGGITFQAGVFSGLGSDMTSAYRLVFIVALSGFVLFNTIFVLLYIISKLTQKNIATECKYSYPINKTSVTYRKCGEFECRKSFCSKSSLCILWHRYSYVFLINGILLTMMFFDFGFYLSNRFQSSIFLFGSIIICFTIILTAPLLRKIYYEIQWKRWILKAENDLLITYLYPSQNNLFGFEAIKSALGLLSGNILGDQNKPDDTFENYIENIEIKEKDSLKQKRKSIKKQIIDYIISVEKEKKKIYEHVSTSDSIVNRKKNKTLIDQAIYLIEK